MSASKSQSHFVAYFHPIVSIDAINPSADTYDILIFVSHIPLLLISID